MRTRDRRQYSCPVRGLVSVDGPTKVVIGGRVLLTEGKLLLAGATLGSSWRGISILPSIGMLEYSAQSCLCMVVEHIKQCHALNQTDA